MKTTNPATLWLRCKASSGQFENEVAINAAEYNGDSFSLFADRRFLDCPDCVEGQQTVDALLQVVELAREGDLVVVRLPGRTLANGQTVTVRATELECEVCQEV